MKTVQRYMGKVFFSLTWITLNVIPVNGKEVFYTYINIDGKFPGRYRTPSGLLSSLVINRVCRQGNYATGQEVSEWNLPVIINKKADLRTGQPL